MSDASYLIEFIVDRRFDFFAESRGPFAGDRLYESHRDGGDLRSRHLVARVEVAEIIALDETRLLERLDIGYRPVREGRLVRERLYASRVGEFDPLVVHISHEERRELLTENGSVRLERRRGHAFGDAVLDRPADRIGVILVPVHVLEVHLSLHARDVVAGHSRKDGDDLTAGHRLLRPERRVRRAVHDTAFPYEANGINVPFVRRNVTERQRAARRGYRGDRGHEHSDRHKNGEDKG